MPCEVAGPAVTVVIPAYNAHASIAHTIAAITNQTYDGPVAIIVVDDGSSDTTAMVAMELGATVISQDNAGPASARNVGADAAKGDIVVFTDADCVPDRDFLAVVVERFGCADNPDVVMGAYTTSSNTIISRLAQLEFDHRYARLSTTEPIDFAATYAMAIRADSLDKSNGFDESFEHPDHEDLELAWRLASDGARLVFAPSATVDHVHADSVRDYLQTKTRRGAGRLSTLRQHPTKMLRDDYTPPDLKMQVALALGLPVLLAARSSAPGRCALRIAGAASLLSTVPLVRQAAATDPALIPLVPAFAFGRAAALALGLVAQPLGFAKHLW